MTFYGVCLDKRKECPMTGTLLHKYILQIAVKLTFCMVDINVMNASDNSITKYQQNNI